MADATFCGDNVEVTCGALSGIDANGLEWTIEVSMDIYERTSGWDSADDWKDFCQSWKEWGGSWRGVVDDTDKILCDDADTCTATFQMSATDAIVGGIIITGVTINAVFKGQVSYTVTFKGIGKPTCPGDAP